MADIEALAVLNEIRFNRAQAEMKDIIAAEASLRKQILDLRTQAAAVDANGPTEMHALGADILWRGWVDRMLTQLTTELAQVLARKEQHLAQVRHAFSRMMASKDLVERERQTAIASRREAQLAYVLETDAILRIARNDQ